jgi:hypothetical protein
MRRVRELWPAVIDEVKRRSVRTGEFLRTATVGAGGPAGPLVVEVAGQTTLRHLKGSAPRQLIQHVLRDLIGFSPEIEVQLVKEERPSTGEREDRPIEEEPIFRKAQDIFRGHPR